MRNLRVKFLLLGLVLNLYPLLPNAQAAPPVAYETFTQNSTGVFFNGEISSTISHPPSAEFAIGSADFTIAWWQKAEKIQTGYPRLFQFGSGEQNSNSFAVSEEEGDIYFWLDNRATGVNGVPGAQPRLSADLPDNPNAWMHFAIVRSGCTINLYFDGILNTSYVEAPSQTDNPNDCSSSLTTPENLGQLELIIGGSADAGLGSFEGSVTGFEFIRGVKWTGNFTPPTVYTNSRCARVDDANQCLAERVFFLYPTIDFNQAPNQLLNLQNNIALTVGAGVTFGPPVAPPPPVTEIDMSVIAAMNGEICVAADVDNNICTTNGTFTYTFDQTRELEVTFIPDTGYQLNSITITPAGAAGVLFALDDSGFDVLDAQANTFNFFWSSELSQLLTPSDLTDFEVRAEFISSDPPTDPPTDPSPGITQDSVAESITSFGSDLVISSANPMQANDYSAIETAVIEIEYLSHQILTPNFAPQPESCVLLVDMEVTGDNFSEILLSMPSGSEIFGVCPDYHQSDEITLANVYFFDYFETENIEDYQFIDAIDSLEIEIESLPGIESTTASAELNYGDEIIFTPSNLDQIESLVLLVFSNDSFRYGWCTIHNSLRDEENIPLPEFLIGNNLIRYQLPTLDQMSQYCQPYFKDEVTQISPDINYNLWLVPGNSNNDGELNAVFTLLAPSNTEPGNIEDNSQNPPPNPSPVIIAPQIVIPPTQELVINSPVDQELSKPTTEAVKQEVEAEVREELVESDTSWCTKKGIWIYTVTGKLQMCDPVKKIALEMPACAGKEKTPTYPWIFRAQRFIAGTLNTKSGTELHNAIFFYKGLAISGSDEVSDEPCSNGSVFIPMAYSKTVFNFAKQQKPLIWVKQQ